MLELVSVKMLHKIKMFVDINKHIICTCTGDVNQTKPVNFPYNNVKDYKKYLFNCVSKIFPSIILLKEPKRQIGEGQVELHKKLHKDLFDESIPIATTILKYFSKNLIYTMDSPGLSKQNICYFKFRRHSIISHIMKVDNKKEMFEENDEIVVSKEFSLGLEDKSKSKSKSKKTIRFNTNNIYKIISKHENYAEIQHVNDESKKCNLPIKELSNFYLNYAGTCHSYQGDTINGITTIFDINTPYVSREWVYTALTRITDFNNMRIFWHSDESILSLENSKVQQYIKFKIANYSRIDKERFTDNIFETISYKQTEELLNKYPSCVSCDSKFYFILHNGDINSNFTLDRIDNTHAHTVNNVRCLCTKCNCALSNREVY